MKAYFLFIVLFIPLSVNADEVKFTASAPSTVRVGENFRVTFELNDRPASFSAPSFEGFRIVTGPMQSSSSSVQIINGEITRTQTVTYTYVLSPVEEGSFSISPAEAVINGDKYHSNSLSVTVIESDEPSQATADPARPSVATSADDRELFVKAYVSNTNPFQGEQVIITYKIYTRVTITQYSIERLPSYQGFWSENITDYDRARQTTTEIINGQRYQIAEIRRVALFPQRSGEMVVEPLEVDCFVRRTTRRSSGSWFDDFFSSPDRSQTVRETIRSDRITLNVKPLPAQNRPATFKGLVGDFSLTASMKDEQLQTNDATSLNVEISGNGNLRMAELPEINFPVNLDVYDPRITDNIRSATSGISGSRSFEYLIIPRTEGEFEIPPVKLSYFDPVSKSYKTLSSDKFLLIAEGGPAAVTASERVAGEDVRYIGNDIRYIYPRNINLNPLGSIFFRSPLFYALLAIPAMLFIVFMILWYNKIRNKSNLVMMRTKQANKAARKRLKHAGKLLQQNKDVEFYDEIFKTLWGYVSDKMNIPVSELNKDNVKENLTAKKVPDSIIKEFISTLDSCEYARFAPGDKEKNMDEVFALAHDTIVSTEKWLRKENA